MVVLFYQRYIVQVDVRRFGESPVMSTIYCSGQYSSPETVKYRIYIVYCILYWLMADTVYRKQDNNNKNREKAKITTTV